jgi:hypothetical protein
MNTRVAVPLTQEAYDAVSFLADLNGVSRGRYLADLLEAAVPSILAVERAYRAAMDMDVEQRALIVNKLDAALREAFPRSALTASKGDLVSLKVAP